MASLRIRVSAADRHDGLLLREDVGLRRAHLNSGLVYASHRGYEGAIGT